MVILLIGVKPVVVKEALIIGRTLYLYAFAQRTDYGHSHEVSLFLAMISKHAVCSFRCDDRGSATFA